MTATSSAAPKPTATPAAVQAARAALTQRVPAASLHAFRVFFGVLMIVAVARFFANGWIDEYFHAPTHFFHYWGFAWVKPWPAPWMHVHFAVMAALAACVALGFHPRVAAAAFGLLFAYAHLCDKTNYLNHYYLIVQVSFLIALLPVGARDQTVPAWTLWAVRAQVGLVYFFGGVAKLGPDWLLHAEPLTTWLRAHEDFPLLGAAFQVAWVPHVASWAAAAFDLTIVGFLCWRRTRLAAFVVLVAFHLMTVQLFHLGLFPWLMIAFSTVFFAPAWPARFCWPRAAVTPPSAPTPALAQPAFARFARVVPAVLAAHLVLQVLVPWRSVAYAGDPLWTEQGFRFAWKVMLMEKSGVVELHVREPATGRTWVVPPTDYYTRYQASMMATQPDMILEAAHVVAADFRARGVRDPQVTVSALVSLHGRPRARLIDPDVDLARERDGLAAASWILPFPTGTRP